MQKNFATTSEKVKVNLAHAVLMTKKWDVVTTKHVKLRLDVGQSVAFGNRKMARFEAEVVKVTQGQSSSLARAKRLSFVVQAPELVEGAKNLCEFVLALETVARAKVLRGGRSRARKSNRNMADAEAELEQTRGELDVGNARVEDLGAFAMKLEKQLD